MAGKNVQGEKNAGGKGREGLFQIKQHPTGFIGSVDDQPLKTIRWVLFTSSGTYLPRQHISFEIKFLMRSNLQLSYILFKWTVSTAYHLS